MYNGNISQTQWKTANTDSSLKTYDYTYDALNRITSGIDNTSNYNLASVAYDKNGNITNLVRKGHKDEVNPIDFDVIDNLDYYYNGNQLHSVTDNTIFTTGFKDGNSSSDAIYDNGNDDYVYDENGNMISDANKGITNITYNHLNLPTLVTISNTEHNGNIQYIYDATGAKLKKIATEGSSVTTTYAGNYIYEDSGTGDVLKFFNQAEGYVEPKDASDYSLGFEYVYQYKDHLGNIRLSYKDVSLTSTPSLEIQEENNYYPFGLEHKGYNNVVNGTENKYQTYNGKELEEELGKNTLAYGWRDYDPAIGRFNKIDRFAEKYYNLSTYSYAGNNPILFIDVQGDSISAGSQKKFDRIQRKVEKTRDKLQRKAVMGQTGAFE